MVVAKVKVCFAFVQRGWRSVNKERTQQSLVMDCPCDDRSEAGLGESGPG